MSYITNLLAQNQRIMGQCKHNKLYHMMNNMKYSKYIKDLDVDKFALERKLDVENKVYTDGAYVFKNENGIQAIYDYVNQTLFSNDEDLIKGI
jgi:uncharacterized phage-like protein YoqJ